MTSNCVTFFTASSVSHELLLDLPDDTVTGSARATVSVMGMMMLFLLLEFMRKIVNQQSVIYWKCV